MRISDWIQTCALPICRRQGGHRLAGAGDVLAERHDAPRRARRRRKWPAAPCQLCDDAGGSGALTDRILIPRARTPAPFTPTRAGAEIRTLAGGTRGTRWGLQAVGPPTGGEHTG